MQGIYLHVLADTLGSVSVVASTLLTHWTGWPGWDPVASVFISALILLSARPLVVSSAKRLLIGVPSDVEYNLRNVLAGISQQKGVVGCAVPKFWLQDGGLEDTHHSLSHSHGHDHDHEHNHGGSLNGRKLQGIIHVIAGHGSSIDEVRDRVKTFLARNCMDVVVQVEREGDSSCWCGFGRTSPPRNGIKEGPKNM